MRKTGPESHYTVTLSIIKTQAKKCDLSLHLKECKLRSAFFSFCLSFNQCKQIHPSKHTCFISVEVYFMLHFLRPNFTAIDQRLFTQLCLSITVRISSQSELVPYTYLFHTLAVTAESHTPPAALNTSHK